MLDIVLAAIAAALWCGAYGWYFQREIRAALWRWRNRKHLALQRAEMERERMAQAYAAWLNSAPSRTATAHGGSRRPARIRSVPPAQPASAAVATRRPEPRPSATIIKFPVRGPGKSPPS